MGSEHEDELFARMHEMYEVVSVDLADVRKTQLLQMRPVMTQLEKLRAVMSKDGGDSDDDGDLSPMIGVAQRMEHGDLLDQLVMLLGEENRVLNEVFTTVMSDHRLAVNSDNFAKMMRLHASWNKARPAMYDELIDGAAIAILDEWVNSAPAKKSDALRALQAQYRAHPWSCAVYAVVMDRIIGNPEIDTQHRHLCKFLLEEDRGFALETNSSFVSSAPKSRALRALHSTGNPPHSSFNMRPVTESAPLAALQPGLLREIGAIRDASRRVGGGAGAVTPASLQKALLKAAPKFPVMVMVVGRAAPYPVEHTTQMLLSRGTTHSADQGLGPEVLPLQNELGTTTTWKITHRVYGRVPQDARDLCLLLETLDGGRTYRVLAPWSVGSHFILRWFQLREMHQWLTQPNAPSSVDHRHAAMGLVASTHMFVGEGTALPDPALKPLRNVDLMRNDTHHAGMQAFDQLYKGQYRGGARLKTPRDVLDLFIHEDIISALTVSLLEAFQGMLKKDGPTPNARLTKEMRAEMVEEAMLSMLPQMGETMRRISREMHAEFMRHANTTSGDVNVMKNIRDQFAKNLQQVLVGAVAANENMFQSAAYKILMLESIHGLL